MTCRITQEELKAILEYNTETGFFTWKVNKRGHVKKGDIGGTLSPSDGYIYLKLNQKRYAAHRLAFLYMTGSWPKEEVDHINHSRPDNRWCNIRECSPSQNKANTKKISTNTSGYKGVCWDKRSNKWFVRVTVNYKDIYAGYFDCKHEAALAYNAKALELHGEFACLNEVAA